MADSNNEAPPVDGGLTVPSRLPTALAKSCEIVLQKGVTWNKYARNFTPLHLAARLNSDEAVRWLLNASACVQLNVRDDDKDMRPIDVARDRGCTSLLGLLDPERLKAKPTGFACACGKDTACCAVCAKGWAEVQPPSGSQHNDESTSEASKECEVSSRSSIRKYLRECLDAAATEKAEEEEEEEEECFESGMPIHKVASEKLVVPPGLPPALAMLCKNISLKGLIDGNFDENYTPLHLAARLSSSGGVKFLLNARAAVLLECREDKNQMRPVDIAKEKRNHCLMALLDPERFKAKPSDFRCSCGKDVAACKVCEKGWAQIEPKPSATPRVRALSAATELSSGPVSMVPLSGAPSSAGGYERRGRGGKTRRVVFGGRSRDRTADDKPSPSKEHCDRVTVDLTEDPADLHPVDLSEDPVDLHAADLSMVTDDEGVEEEPTAASQSAEEVLADSTATLAISSAEPNTRTVADEQSGGYIKSGEYVADDCADVHEETQASEEWQEWHQWVEAPEDLQELPPRVDASEEIEAEDNCAFWEAEMHDEGRRYSVASSWGEALSRTEMEQEEEKQNNEIEDSFNLELRMAMIKYQSRRIDKVKVFREDR